MPREKFSIPWARLQNSISQNDIPPLHGEDRFALASPPFIEGEIGIAVKGFRLDDVRLGGIQNQQIGVGSHSHCPFFRIKAKDLRRILREDADQEWQIDPPLMNALVMEQIEHRLCR
jgi:hypothetical protein